MKQKEYKERDVAEPDESALFNRIKVALDEKQVAGIENRIAQAFREERSVSLLPVRIAAAILVMTLVTTSLVILVRPQRIQFYNRYFAPYNSEFVTGIYRDQASGKSQAVQFYSMKKYGKAIPAIRKYLEADPGDAQIRLLLGICLMEKGQPDQAEAEFKRVIASGQDYFKADAIWYLSLLYVKRGQYRSALAELEKIHDSAFYSERVISLEKQIYSGNKNQ